METSIGARARDLEQGERDIIKSSGLAMTGGTLEDAVTLKLSVDGGEQPLNDVADVCGHSNGGMFAIGIP